MGAPTSTPGRNLSNWLVRLGSLLFGREGGGLVFEPPLGMDAVGPRFRHAVDDEAARAAVLGGHAAARDVDLLDVELREVLVEVAEERVGDVDAVVEERVVLAAAAGVEPSELFSATPGASWKVPVNVRASGSFSIVLRVVTTEMSVDLVSTSGAAAVTVTVSAVVARRTG